MLYCCGMSKKQKKPLSETRAKAPGRHTPTFLLELPRPRQCGPGQTHPGAPGGRPAVLQRCALRGATTIATHASRSGPGRAARALPRARKQERAAAFDALWEQYGFSAYGLHRYAKGARQAWLAEHLDAVLAQTLATRAYQALNRVCLGKARRVRFKSRGRGLDSIENKRNDTGLRFVLQQPEQGNDGYVIWKDDRLAALIDWNDPVVTHGLGHRVKYARLVQRKASSPQAAGADVQGYRYAVQLVLEGLPHHKPKHTVGTDTIGADLGPIFHRTGSPAGTGKPAGLLPGPGPR